MATFRHALVLLALLGAGPAFAQSPVGIEAGRRVTTTGQPKPPKPVATPSSLSTPAPKPLSQAEMVKVQKAAEARSKAWDVRTRRSMGSICNGC